MVSNVEDYLVFAQIFHWANIRNANISWTTRTVSAEVNNNAQTNDDNTKGNRMRSDQSPLKKYYLHDLIFHV